ncbi:transcriptional regulator [Roseivirga ehrenbergii]|uniref:Transcriptional regulator n=1 Tax=Roseivirga ehrenbergii (strain DSM 102268 / JCM 13514 / KCTC 12282 / NCIMB 14502 / KMM 6017) TaxID=279360 RepID=A0A150X8S8_ROSEK|nr:response regulator [Roseivirga ehrenbergii]KYG75128.1 transcriptional regulator [Roseivirga ehrenbergii]
MAQKAMPSILFIEDDMIERMKFDRTVTKLGFTNKIIEASNGEEALHVLEEKDIVPNIIFLDLNMPRISGLEFLQKLKSDERLKFIPTIVLTTSNNHRDVLECYRMGIAGYILKPLKYDDYVDKIDKVLSYWNINQLITV